MFSKYSFLHAVKQSESAMVLILYWSIKLGKIEYSFPPFLPPFHIQSYSYSLCKVNPQVFKTSYLCSIPLPEIECTATLPTEI